MFTKLNRCVPSFGLPLVYMNNGRPMGEFGECAVCASQLGLRTIFGSGDLAFTKEAQALVPGIETVAVCPVCPAGLTCGWPSWPARAQCRGCQPGR